MKPVTREELRPCRCGKPLGPMFFVVESSLALVDAQSARQTAGLEMAFGGGSFGASLANAMGPGVKVTLAAEVQPELLDRRLVCMDCHWRVALALEATS